MLLGPDDALTSRPQRVLVAGTSGAGKTTLAARLGRMLDLPHIEIDSLFHGAGWTARPEFLDDVRAFTATPRWITEWQYRSVRQLLAERAELMVWLDLPRWLVIRQVTVRTVRRRLGRQLLWNGNIEPPLRTILRDPEHIVRWAWRTHASTAERVAGLAESRPELPIVRLRNRAQIDHWLEIAANS